MYSRLVWGRCRSGKPVRRMFVRVGVGNQCWGCIGVRVGLKWVAAALVLVGLSMQLHSKLSSETFHLPTLFSTKDGACRAAHHPRVKNRLAVVIPSLGGVVQGSSSKVQGPEDRAKDPKNPKNPTCTCTCTSKDLDSPRKLKPPQREADWRRPGLSAIVDDNSSNSNAATTTTSRSRDPEIQRSNGLPLTASPENVGWRKTDSFQTEA